MGTKNNPGTHDCYAKAEPDEPMFVLLGRDPVASIVVRFWVMARMMLEHGPGGLSGDKIREYMSSEKIQEAYACVCALEEWATGHGKADQVGLAKEAYELLLGIAHQVERRAAP